VPRLGAGALGLALTGLAAASAPASPVRPAPVGPVLTAMVAPRELTYGAALTVSGGLTNGGVGLGGAALALQADAYPFRGFLTIARSSTAPDGSFAFASVRLNRNTSLRVVAAGAQDTTSPPLGVVVDPRADSYARSLGPGRTRLSLRLRHTRIGGSAPAVARWFVAARGTRFFHLAAVTLTWELSRGLTYASAIVDPPSKRFVYRVCLNPSWGYAMGPAATHRPCPQEDFTVPRHVG
jgi:hypothetical protein